MGDDAATIAEILVQLQYTTAEKTKGSQEFSCKPLFVWLPEQGSNLRPAD